MAWYNLDGVTLLFYNDGLFHQLFVLSSLPLILSVPLLHHFLTYIRPNLQTNPALNLQNAFHLLHHRIDCLLSLHIKLIFLSRSKVSRARKQNYYCLLFVSFCCCSCSVFFFSSLINKAKDLSITLCDKHLINANSSPHASLLLSINHSVNFIN